MIDLGDILTLCFPFIVIISVISIYNILTNEQVRKIELIKNTNEYQVYDVCHSLDDKFYCYNLEK